MQTHLEQDFNLAACPPWGLPALELMCLCSSLVPYAFLGETLREQQPLPSLALGTNTCPLPSCQHARNLLWTF